MSENAALLKKIDQETEETQRVDRLQALGHGLQGKLNDAIRQRIPIEQRWINDMRQYHGRYDAKVEAVMKDPKFKRSQVFINITRAKTLAAESRISDMLFPSDDRNWMINPTPVPELDMAVKNGDMNAIALHDEAAKRAQAMQSEIDDQLTESDYNVNARRGIHQAAILGTMVLKGPVIVNRTRQAWRTFQDDTGQSVQVLATVKETNPAVEWIDLWNFYPDLSARYIEDADFIFERKFLTRRKMRELIERPGFLAEQVREVLRNDPAKFSNTSGAEDYLEKLRDISGITSTFDDKRYELWEYHGPIDPEDLRCCGVMVDDDADAAGIEAIVLFVGDIVIFADLNPMETGDRPYSLWTWEEDEACMLGYGVPYLMRVQQEVINSAWRLMMDNAGMSAGPQIVIKPQKIIPVDGDWTMTPMKLWKVLDPGAEINDILRTYDINSHQGEIANIINLSKQLVDEETNLPLIAQGSLGQLPQNTPAATTSMMMNAANTIIRRMVKLFDDNIIKPTISRFYDWNMQFNPNESIKGDFQVDARGSSSLLVKEMQSQQLMQFAQFFGHPSFGAILMPKAVGILRKIAESMRLPVDEVIPTDEELAQIQQAQAQQESPPDPRIVAAQIHAQAELKRAEFAANANNVEMQVRERMAQQDYAAKIASLELEREVKMLSLAATEKMTLEQIRSHLAETAIRERSRQQLFSAERNLKLSAGSGI